MSEEINYYEKILQLTTLEQELETINTYNEAILLQLKLLNLIFSEDILKQYFIERTNDFIRVTKNEYYDASVKKIFDKIRKSLKKKSQYPYINISTQQGLFADILFYTSNPKIFYFPVMMLLFTEIEKQKYFDGIFYLYNNVIPNYAEPLTFLNRNFIKNINFYVITLDTYTTLDRCNNTSEFNRLWLCSAIKGVIFVLKNDLYNKSKEIYNNNELTVLSENMNHLNTEEKSLHLVTIFMTIKEHPKKTKAAILDILRTKDIELDEDSLNYRIRKINQILFGKANGGINAIRNM